MSQRKGRLPGQDCLEHMVDTVLYFEGERHHTYRILRAVKNRFGSTNEMGIFEMKEFRSGRSCKIRQKSFLKKGPEVPLGQQLLLPWKEPVLFWLKFKP